MCDSLVATGSHARDGVTVFAKNSDRSAGECQPFLQVPGALHARGSSLRCTHIEIPQVAETYRAMGHSPWWVWGFEHGVNEHALAVGNHTVFTREEVEARPGLIGMDLVRLALERSRDAREGLEVIAALIERHGQGGAALAPGAAGYHNSFLLADPREAWVLETSGRRWAGRRVERASLTNQLTLGDDWQIASRDLETFARKAGYWRRSGRIDVAGAYRHPEVPGALSEGRLRRSSALLASRDELDSEAFTGFLRDHGEHTQTAPVDCAADSEEAFSLCMHNTAVATTTASLVVSLPSDVESAWPVWAGFGSPCVGVLLPLYLDGMIPSALARGGEHTTEGSAWWSFQALGDSAAKDFAERTPRIRQAWQPFEAALERERQQIESEVEALRGAGKQEEARDVLSAFMQRSCDAAMARADEIRREL